MVDVDKVVAELLRERQKNAELLRRVTALEAQLQFEKEKGINENSQDGYSKYREEKVDSNCKRQKIESPQHADCISPKELKLKNGLVSSMIMDDTPCKNDESILEFEETDDDSSDEDEDTEFPMNLRAIGEIATSKMFQRTQQNQTETNFPSISQKAEQDSCRIKNSARYKNLSLQKKPPKVAFCPTEIKAMLKSRALELMNAQSHTMRKIIVFASLGIKHGCDDMYELDYDHFSIMRKGEPYISADNPGEHVVYNNPSMKRKMFFPNRENPALCPVQILEEEKTMRPSDIGCPSCLFLCIKYGGRTRNIPQNEYVRQRMGRNKLKSFGPRICEMARLIDVRTGSFFFKTLGITLLFMAGYPNDIVQKETKHKSLDLLQKYYRSDEDAAGQELFVTNPSTSDHLDFPSLDESIVKTKKKHKGKKKMKFSSNADSENHPQVSLRISSGQFGLQGYTPAQKFQQPAETETSASQTLIIGATISTPVANPKPIHSQQSNFTSHHHPPLYPFIPIHPPNPMMPFMYWPSMQTAVYPPFPYPPSYGYRPLVTANRGPHYLPIPPQSKLYGQGLETYSTVLAPRPDELGAGKKCSESDEVVVSDSESCSDSTKPN